MKEKEILSLEEIVKLLIEDNVGIVPSETIYGICAKYSKENQIKINQIKHSPIDKPITCLITNLNQLQTLNIAKEKIENINEFYTGKLTILTYNGDRQLVGVKWSNLPQLKFICDRVGPLLLTSVNLSGEKEIYNLKDLDNEIKKNIAFVVDGEVGKASSTIINIEENKIIRQGEILWQK